MNLSELSIATFNQYILNLPGRALYADSQGWSQEQYDLKIRWAAWKSRLHKSDVFGYQELWHAKALAHALAEFDLAGEYDPLVPPNADGKRIVCAAIVRKGLLASEPNWIADFPQKFTLRATADDPQTPSIDVNTRGFSRPLLHFTIKPRADEPPVHVYVCHFKSKAPTKVFTERWFKADKETFAKQPAASMAPFQQSGAPPKPPRFASC